MITATAPAATGTTRTRRATGWVLIAVVLVAAGVAAAALSGIGQWSRRGVLDPESAGPDGARAIAQILSEHGVRVHVVRDHAGLDSALRDAGGTEGRPARATLALSNSPFLTDTRIRTLARAATDVVVVQPQARGLRLLFDSTPAGFGAPGPVAPACALPAAERAGAIRPGARFAVPHDGMTACYPAGGGAALLQRTGSTTLTAVDGTVLFTNETLTADGNAALAVGLLGRNATLIWYVPSPQDAPAGAPTLGDLTPDWVSPAIVLLLAAGAAAAVWRGRRFGPLVFEDLPVTVRAAETTRGRARLYARSGDRVHVADRLRIGTLERIAAMLALGSAASAPEIADAAADLLRMPRAAARAVLFDDRPGTDRELLALSDRLRALEDAVRAARRPASDTDTDTDTDPARSRP